MHRLRNALVIISVSAFLSITYGYGFARGSAYHDNLDLTVRAQISQIEILKFRVCQLELQKLGVDPTAGCPESNHPWQNALNR